jgi:glutamate N-acetyltransferase/amino-acid N-acetyltransferase
MKTISKSPLAPKESPSLPPVSGVRLAAGGFGLRYQGRPDVLLALCDEGTVAAGVFSKSTTTAMPVDWCREALKTASPRALLVNAGQANCFVGDAADALITATTDKVAALAGCDARQVLVASTGVIGEPVPQEKLVAAVPELHAQLKADDWEQAAHAICTTDTFPKLATRSASIGGTQVTINGIAKGSGMIAPNMATMLGFVFTDAAIPREALQQLLSDTNAKSFNCITVDGDCSTNDCVLAYATGKAGNAPIEHVTAPEAHDFRVAFEALMIDLAQQIVRDGEGAQKFITVHVNGAQTEASAHKIAMDIANSPLVKTAIAGEDANWGRVVMAIGKSGEPVDKTAISIAFGEHMIARSGTAIAGYDEAPVAAYMKEQNIDITVEVGAGMGEAKVWTCDLTHGYIDINADYRS